MKHLDIKVDGSTVTLDGTLNSWHERGAARGVAGSAPGLRVGISEPQIG